MEIWKDIKGYEGLYQASNMGNIRSLNYGRTGKIKALRPRPDKDGYSTVSLCKNKSVKNCKVHRLIAQTFIDNPDNKPEVNHIDCNKANNCISNLEWTTRKENQRHAWNNGLCETAREAVKQNVSLATEAARTVNEKPVKCITTGKIYNSIAEAQRQTGVLQSNISRCCKGKSKSAGKSQTGEKLIWQYAEEE